MTIDKAIEILHQEVATNPFIRQTDLQDALKLGIEALKRLEDNRKGYAIPPNDPLTGETKGEQNEST